MTNRFSFTCLGLLLILFAKVSFAAAEYKLPEIEVLPNGLTVAWFLSDRIPIVDFTLAVRAGHRE